MLPNQIIDTVLKENSKKYKLATTEEQWKLASEIIEQGEKHPALVVIKNQYEAILESIKRAAKLSDNMKKNDIGRTEDPTLVITQIKPEIEKLSKIADAVSKQLTQRLRGLNSD